MTTLNSTVLVPIQVLGFLNLVTGSHEKAALFWKELSDGVSERFGDLAITGTIRSLLEMVQQH